MILPLLYFGHPLLRKKAKPVQSVTLEIKELVKDMLDTMDQLNGIGLAAPQVGHSIRLFILRNYLEGEDGHLHLGDVEVFINPQITIQHVKPIPDIEGCLSIPGIREEVERPLHLTVEAMNLEGNIFKEEVIGYKARVILHENDHLNGVLFVDRLPTEIKNKVSPLLDEIKKKYSPRKALGE